MNDENTEHDTIYQALLVIKAELGPVTKSLTNPFHKSRYADINIYLEVVEPILQRHGCVLLQNCRVRVIGEKPVNVVCSRIVHVASGDEVEAELALPYTEDLQKLGAGITYARRYTLGSLLAMQAEDDDGNTATGRTVKKNGAPANPSEHLLESGPEVVGGKKFRGASVQSLEPKLLNWALGKNLLDDYDANAVRAHLSATLTSQERGNGN